MKTLTQALLACSLSLAAALPAAANDSPVMFIQKATAKVAKAMAFPNRWEGPTSGPAVTKKRLVVMITWDQRQPAIAALVAGAKEAATAAGWNFATMDCYGMSNRRPEAFSRAMALKPDAIILAGVDAADQQKEIAQAAKANIPVVGWHASATIGPAAGLFTNVGTDPKEAGQLAAGYVVADSKGKAGVVVYADTSTSYQAAKTSAIVDMIKGCQGCSLLNVEAMPSDPAARAAQFSATAKKYAGKITHTIAASDDVYDFGAAPMPVSAQPPVAAIAAGEGSRSAFQRINDGGLQVGTVPEPLAMQGWQLIDEVNRAVSGDKPSGYVAPAYLVTAQNKTFHGGPKNMFDPNNNYRDEYRKIWKK